MYDVCLWNIFTGCPLQDAGSGMHDKAKERFGDDVVQMATANALDDSKLKPIRDQHRIFQEVSQLYLESLELLTKRRYVAVPITANSS